MKNLVSGFLAGTWPSFDTIEDHPVFAVPLALLILGQYFFVVGLVCCKKSIEAVTILKADS